LRYLDTLIFTAPGVSVIIRINIVCWKIEMSCADLLRHEFVTGTLNHLTMSRRPPNAVESRLHKAILSASNKV